MYFLSGAQALDPQTYALDTFVARLEARLVMAPYLTQFAPWGGVDVTRDDTKALKLVRAVSKRPFLFLEVAHYDSRDRKGLGTRHEMEISLEIYASDASANAILLLRPAVLEIIRSDYIFYREAAIQGVRIASGQGQNTQPERLNPNTIHCMVDTAVPS